LKIVPHPLEKALHLVRTLLTHAGTASTAVRTTGSGGPS